MASVALAVTEGMSLFELSIPFAIFGLRRPEITPVWYDLVVCSPDGTRIGDHFRTETPHGLDSLVHADTVVVPACDVAIEAPPPDLVDAVREAHRRGARVASICTGAFVLAAAGLLDGRTATTHWMYTDELRRRYPAIEVDPSVLYVDSGDVLTSAGQAAGIDLCLHMVRTDHGAAVAGALARRLVVQPHREGGQSQFISPLSAGKGYNGLTELLEWVIENLHEPLTVADIAREARMSTRNLGRHFVATTGSRPLQWLLAQRVHRAQELLETTDHGIDHIADLVGIGTPTTLRRHFNRIVGIAPDAYRRMYRDHGPPTPARSGTASV